MHSMKASASGPGDGTVETGLASGQSETGPTSGQSDAPRAGNDHVSATDPVRSSADSVRANRDESGAPARLDLVDETELAGYLLAHPDFFARHGEVLVGVRVPDPTAGRAISLHERQLSVMRERHRKLEFRLAELVRAGQENDSIADRLAAFTRDLLLIRAPVTLPAKIETTLADSFRIPHVAVRTWDVAEAFGGESFVITPDGALRSQADAMQKPYCGLRNDAAPVAWFDDQTADIRSVALLPLRRSAGSRSFGMILLGSSDPDRFQSGMGTSFLERLAEVASAALSRLLPDGDVGGDGGGKGEGAGDGVDDGDDATR